MSASLVGSEMCIRDRPPAWGGPAKAPRELERDWRAPGGTTRPGPQGSHCLLYTSDAADDM
eukprot:13783366-Alexandrium_andersonii.AAC.1